MSDRITYCDVVESCKECPRYGIDCDGDKRTETPTLNEKHQLSAETPTDLISRADVIRLLVDKYKFTTSEATEILSELPSADAVSREFYEDVVKANHELAKENSELKEQIESAEAAQGEWIFRTDIPIGGGRESAGYVCSNCRKDYFRVDGMNFCPNCGAKMKGGDGE